MKFHKVFTGQWESENRRYYIIQTGRFILTRWFALFRDGEFIASASLLRDAQEMARLHLLARYPFEKGTGAFPGQAITNLCTFPSHNSSRTLRIINSRPEFLFEMMQFHIQPFSTSGDDCKWNERPSARRTLPGYIAGQLAHFERSF